MQNPRLATRYAKSLIDLAGEQNVRAEVLADMQLLDNICTQSNEFRLMLRNPVIKPDKKSAIIHAVLSQHTLQKLSLAFMDLLVRKGREANLSEIAKAYITQYKSINNINVVHLTTAAPMSDQLRNQIKERVAASVNGSVELHEAVNEDLIGGFVLEMNDKLFDASVRRDLNDIKKQFEYNLYIPSK